MLLRPVHAGTFVLALAGALFCQAVQLPLPWMIGPLLVTAAARMAGLPLAVPAATRPFGQWVIGSGLGLYFTPPVLATLAAGAPAVLAGALGALALGTLAGRLLARLAGIDAATAFFASMPGGAAEMANLGERHGARSDRVAAAHSLRVLIVIVLVPAAFTASGLHGSEVWVPAARSVSLPGLATLFALGAPAALLWQRWRQPNPWIVGPLCACAALSASGLTLSALPPGLVMAAQLAIGCSLGCRFTPDFFHAAPRFLAAVAVVTCGLLAAAASFGLLLAALAGLPVAAVVLGTAPGGIAEMCVTAQVLQLGVPLVTAFHVIRMLAVVLSSGPLYVRLARRRAGA